MRTVSATYGCTVVGCEVSVTVDSDALPPGWWSNGNIDSEICPRHAPAFTPVDVPADEVEDAAHAEHIERGRGA